MAVPLPPTKFLASKEAMDRAYSLDDARAYTRQLANSHYENFHVVSFLLPTRLHQDFYNVYAFCRWADDLSDEIGDTAESLRLLAWWRRELAGMFWGEARHPVFVALRDTARRHDLPCAPFEDLITAFEQDQRVASYETFEEILDYCRYSANPVGRLVLYLCGYGDPERQSLSDHTCSALQLANFWQDVAIDLEKNRIYLPLEWLRRFGFSEEDLRARVFRPAFRDVMREAVSRARELFLKGLPLVGMVDRRLALDLDLFTRGGLLVLDKIERLGFNVLERRPAISKAERAALLLRSLCRLPFIKGA